MFLTLEAPRVGAEFRGLARRFRNEVQAEDVRLEKALPAVTAPLVARLRRHPRLRHELVVAAVHLHRKLVPATFRLGEIMAIPSRDEFAIIETRLTATWMRDRT
jgi:hypothetical protein